MGWQCPYCLQYATLRDDDERRHLVGILPNKLTPRGGRVVLSEIVCPNPSCNQLSLYVDLNMNLNSSPSSSEYCLVRKWFLLPDSAAKPMPDYVPEVIRNDYREACLIMTLSPKASATLARRCLQGMIRDFYHITEKSLAREIMALKPHISEEAWESIEAIRKVGNIGAHMEKDIDVILDVEPDEAKLLLTLIEQLIDDWYVARYKRQQQRAAVQEMIGAKEEKKAQAKEV